MNNITIIIIFFIAPALTIIGLILSNIHKERKIERYRHTLDEVLRKMGMSSEERNLTIRRTENLFYDIIITNKKEYVPVYMDEVKPYDEN